MLKLKEKPIEWIKFTAVIGFVVNAVLWLLWKREGLPIAVPMAAACVAVLAVITASFRPYWFRGFYRGGMTVSFQIGQVIGKVLLTLFFFIFVTPLGLLLRLLGKDLLLLKKIPDDKTYWHPAKNNREFDRMF
jgi:MFS family permease